MDELLKSLGSNGPAWTLVAILLLLSWALIKMLLSEKDKRIADAVKNRDDLVQPIGFIKDSLELIEKKIKISKGED
jgi:hypothetical protein